MFILEVLGAIQCYNRLATRLYREVKDNLNTVRFNMADIATDPSVKEFYNRLVNAEREVLILQSTIENRRQAINILINQTGRGHYTQGDINRVRDYDTECADHLRQAYGLADMAKAAYDLIVKFRDQQ